jgi:hypothetical protein
MDNYSKIRELYSFSSPGTEVLIMHRNRRIHDGIAGAVISVGVALGYFVNPLWLLVPGGLGITLLQSAFTGFCPVYFTLDKFSPE